ncbi:MAG: hypothetical protein J0I47_08950 [Sphingomonas sp.]|uniref:hypothetical protein n=1 Tax=Sphingomonas sp. TaxID=28214 RepID=UPI001ACA8430|nr:hypothetical protein [Sphingomonas sp.]MBN8808346.1 hypothetical protein [Sphingomonas sp.]
MTDWFSASLKWQQQVVDAQRASLKAGQDATNAAQAFVSMQEAGRKAAEANAAAMKQWLKLWGW